MNTLNTARLVACVVVLTALAAAGTMIQAGQAPQSPSAAGDQKHDELWHALMNVLPKEYAEIDAYAENASQTTLLLYSQGTVLKFSLGNAKVQRIPVAKVLGRINRITVERGPDADTWALWTNGQRELTLDDRVEGADLSK